MRKFLPKPAKTKLKRIKKSLHRGASISEACGKARISRTTYYRWLKKVKKKKPCSSSLRKFKATRRKEKVLLERKVLRRVVVHSGLTCRQFAKKLGKNPSFVWKILNKHDLGTRKKRKEWARKVKFYPPRAKKYERAFGTRVFLLERAEKIGVSQACREYGVSRTLFYKWKKRQVAGEPLEDKQWKVERWGRQTSQEYEQIVLNLVVQKPELSVHLLVPNLPKVADAPIVSHHGVQNILRRNGLNTYEKRLTYSRAQAPVLVRPVTAWLSRLKLVWEEFLPSLAAAPPPGQKTKFTSFVKTLLTSSLTTTLFLLLFTNFIHILSGQTFGTQIGLTFAAIALTVGSFFFAYSMKYYLTLALVLSFSRQPNEEGVGIGLKGEFKGSGNGNGNGNGKGNQGFLFRIFGLTSGGNGNGKETRAPGLTPSLDHINLSRFPFISIHLPFYNEKNVANRIISACTSFDYPSTRDARSGQVVPNYEVIVCDDSTDETVDIVNQWARHPKVKIIHRPTREGFKGGALKYAVAKMDPKTEFVLVFDADFVPYPDTLTQFLKYFKASGGWDEGRSYQGEKIVTMPYDTFSKVEIPSSQEQQLSRQEQQLLNKSNIACVAGYQWHVLNKSENWITRGVRTEYAGSYVIERPGQEILGSLKIIHGSVYCIRADVLKHFGWGTSITEDFELTLRIYEKGFKVAYTPYIQAPSECVSTIKRLIRQRMRWSEGHSFNVKKMFGKLITNPNLTFMEKLEFLYITPYYLQAFFFLLGTFSWLISETVFKARLPFWTSLWGWSLVLTNLFALPLMNAVGMFLEESEEKDYLGILSFVVLSYLVVPFQAYAAFKGFVEEKEGPWFRTPKTGRITDIFTRGQFYRWVSKIIPGFKPAAGGVISSRLISSPVFSPYLALSTANNRFNQFHIKPKRMKWLAKTFLTILLILSLNLSWLSIKVPLVHASPGTQVKTIEMPIYQYAGNTDDNDISLGIRDEAYSTTTVGDSNSLAFYNGIPYIAYRDSNFGLRFIKCGNDTCSSGNTINKIDGTNNNVGIFISLQVVSGVPYIAYYDQDNADLKFVKCGNDTCSSGNTISIIDSTGSVGFSTSLQVVSGVPYISYYDTTNTNLKFVKCGNDSCSSGNTINTISDPDASVGNYSSLQVVSGVPYISYYGTTNTNLKFVKCGNDTCSSGNTISQVDNTEDDGKGISLAFYNGIPYISYYDATNLDLKFVKCGDDTCDNNPANTISTIDSTDNVGKNSSLQVVSGIPYISYSYLAATSQSFKFVKCGDDTCDNNPANTISTIETASCPSGCYGYTSSLAMISGLPYISFYTSLSGTYGQKLRFAKNTTKYTATYGMPGADFKLDIPETMVDCRSDLTGTNPCYAYVEWRTILSEFDTTTGEMEFDSGENDSSPLTQSLSSLNTNSGESQPLIIRMDVTSKISQGLNTYSFDVEINVVRNTDSAKLVVTYKYDDTAATQVKTVRYALGTQAAQGASGDCGPDITVNPNIQEAGVSIQKAWVEMSGQVSAGTADAAAAVYFQDGTCASGHGYSLEGASTNNTMIDGDNKTTMDFVAMYEPTAVVASGATAGQLNYNDSNTISLYNTAQVMNLKGGELVITYNYSYYNTSNTTHRNTVRYHVGQTLGDLGTAYTQIGAPAVYLPETLTTPNYNVYLKIVGASYDDADIRYKVTITGGSAVEYPGAATYYETVVSEQAGQEVIFIDISDNFSTNWQNGDAVKVEGLRSVAASVTGVGAELIISYNFVIPTSGFHTNIKTVNWFVGQQTAKTTSNPNWTFNTYIPETSTTKRSSGANGNFLIAVASLQDAMELGIDATTANVVNIYPTGETHTNSRFHNASSLTGSSQTGVSSMIESCSGGTCSLSLIESLKGLVAFTTYQASAPAAPEKALIFVFVAPFVPRIITWWRRKKLKMVLIEGN